VTINARYASHFALEVRSRAIKPIVIADLANSVLPPTHHLCLNSLEPEKGKKDRKEKRLCNSVSFYAYGYKVSPPAGKVNIPVAVQRRENVGVNDFNNVSLS
jgi:hypothetical protein